MTVRNVVVFGTFDKNHPSVLTDVDSFPAVVATTLRRMSGVDDLVGRKLGQVRDSGGKPVAAKTHISVPNSGTVQDQKNKGRFLAAVLASGRLNASLRVLLPSLLEAVVSLREALAQDPPGINPGAPADFDFVQVPSDAFPAWDQYNIVLKSLLAVGATASENFTNGWSILRSSPILHLNWNFIGAPGISPATPYPTIPPGYNWTKYKHVSTGIIGGVTKVYTVELDLNDKTNILLKIDGVPTAWNLISGGGVDVNAINGWIVGVRVVEFSTLYSMQPYAQVVGSDGRWKTFLHREDDPKPTANIPSIGNAACEIAMKNDTGAAIAASASVGTLQPVKNAIIEEEDD